MVQIEKPDILLNRLLLVDAVLVCAYMALTLASQLSPSTAAFLLILYLLGALVLWNIYRLKNWARRLYIVSTVLMLASTSATFMPVSRAANVPFSQAFPTISYGLDFINFVITILFAVVLIHPGVRGLFTPTAPRKVQRILLGVFTVLAVLIGMWPLVAGA